MRHRERLRGTVIAIVGVWLASVPAIGQTPTATPKTHAAVKNTSPARTPDGQPDIQGYWQGGASFEDKGFERPLVRPGPADHPACRLGTGVGDAYTECAAYVPLFTGHIDGKPNFGRPPTESTAPRRRSGLIDVPDGKLPLTSAGAAKRAENVRNLFDPPTIEYVDPSARCIPTWDPGGQQFLQIPGYVIILQESNHITRIIPVDGRPHIRPDIRLFGGDSVGRWEGPTLVVDTTNFVGGGWHDLEGTPQSDALHIIERFTIVDANTLDYVVTIDDPKFFTRPWSYAGSLRRSQSAEAQGVQTIEILEHACHEGGSIAVENIMDRPHRPLPPEVFLPR